MIRESERYVENPQCVRRRYATREDKTWSGHGVDVMARLKEVVALDPRVALILELQLLFGLRIKEAMLLRPHLADRESFLAINRGTKGGRDRTVDITDSVQRDALERAKVLAPDRASSLIPKDRSFTSYRKHIYRVCNRAGVGRRFGPVPHGLRHEYANLRYQQLTGRPSPVRGGGRKDISYETERAARQDIAEDLGHSRPSITSAYFGYVRAIGTKFRDRRSVQALIDSLKSGKISPSDLPPIRTFQKDGLTFTLDNRRLFAANEAGVKVRTVPATPQELAKELPRKFTTPNQGCIICIRGTLE